MIRVNNPTEYSQYWQVFLAKKIKLFECAGAFCVIYNIKRIYLKCKTDFFNKIWF